MIDRPAVSGKRGSRAGCAVEGRDAEVFSQAHAANRSQSRPCWEACHPPELLMRFQSCELARLQRQRQSRSAAVRVSHEGGRLASTQPQASTGSSLPHGAANVLLDREHRTAGDEQAISLYRSAERTKRDAAFTHQEQLPDRYRSTAPQGWSDR